jgi:hypothetical protein
MPAHTINVVAIKVKSRPLAASHSSSIEVGGTDDAYTSQWFEVEAGEGTELQARVTIGKREQLSPVFKP